MSQIDFTSKFPLFDPENFDHIPEAADGELFEQFYVPGNSPQAQLGIAEQAREVIRASLEKRHGKKVISRSEYEALRGVASITTYNAVRDGGTIVL